MCFSLLLMIYPIILLEIIFLSMAIDAESELLFAYSIQLCVAQIIYVKNRRLFRAASILLLTLILTPLILLLQFLFQTQALFAKNELAN